MATVPLASLSELKRRMGVEPDYTDTDEQLMDLLYLASSQVEKACKRSFAAGERVETFHTQRVVSYHSDLTPYGGSTTGCLARVQTQVMFLAALPVDIAAEFDVRYDPTRRFDDTTKVASELYTLDPDMGRLVLHLATGQHSNALMVRYTGGYASGEDGTLSASAPQDLKLACLLQARYLSMKTSSVNLGLVADRAQGDTKGTVRWASQGGLVSEAADLVQGYRAILRGKA